MAAGWSVPHSDTNAAAMAEGRGRMNWRRPRAAASTSQMTTTVTKTRIAGRYSRTRRPIRVAAEGEAGPVAGGVVTSIGSAITRPSRRIARAG